MGELNCHGPSRGFFRVATTTFSPDVNRSVCATPNHTKQKKKEAPNAVEGTPIFFTMRYSVVLLSTIVIVLLYAFPVLSQEMHEKGEAHNCMHNVMSAKMMSVHAPQKYQGEEEQDDNVKRSMKHTQLPTSKPPTELPTAQPATKSATKPATGKPKSHPHNEATMRHMQGMRINVNTTLLMNDKGNTCYKYVYMEQQGPFCV